jgi:hypothetical protein
MRKLRGRKSRGSLIDLAAQSSAAAASTAMTLWHRLPMFGMASTAENRAEMTRMVDEKSSAFAEGCVAANMEMFRLLSSAAVGHFAPLFNAHVTIATAGLQPAFKTVNANARRLNRKATRG